MEIIRTIRLSAAQLTAVSELIGCCRLADHTDFTYPAEDPACHYLLLSGSGRLESVFIALDAIEPETLEGLAFTRPEVRKQGFFRLLLDALTEDFPETDLIFPVDHHAAAALSVMAALDADCLSTEHRMELSLSASDLCETESETEAETLMLFESLPEEDGEAAWTLYAGSTGVRLGSCRLTYYNTAACLHHVEIQPDYRRRGYAVRMLSSLCPQLRIKGLDQLFLHVSADNRPALALYQKTGFRITKTLSYYLF